MNDTSMPMDHSMGGMMMDSGPMILGLHFGSFLMIASGIFYLICAGLLWKPFRREKNELLGALFAFLCYQAVAMFFMGLEMQTMNMSYEYIAVLAILIGSVFMLKFPFSSLSRGTRRALFGLSLVAVIGIFTWFMQTPERQMMIMNFSIYYDIVINGLVVGGSIIYFGLTTKDRGARIKSLGGGSGVATCCVAANIAMVTGAVITSTVFQFAAPVIILASLTYARKNQNSPVEM